MAGSTQEWIVRIGEKSYGPYSGAQLKQLSEQGKINAATLVRKHDSQQWFKAEKLKGLFPDQATPPVNPDPGSPPDINNLDLGDVLANDPVMPIQQPRVKPRPADQVKRVVKNRFPIQAMMVNLVAYSLLALAVFSILGTLNGLAATFLVEAELSNDSLNPFSSRGSHLLFIVLAGVASIFKWGIVIGTVILVGLIWNDHRDEKLMPVNCVGPAVGGPILSIILSFLGVAVAFVAIRAFLVLSPVLFVMFYGFLIPLAFLLGNWQKFSKVEAIKNVHIISASITGVSILIYLLGFAFRFVGSPVVSSLATSMSEFIYAASAGFLGYAIMMFTKKVNA